jgi:hypothetical protein
MLIEIIYFFVRYPTDVLEFLNFIVVVRNSCRMEEDSVNLRRSLRLAKKLSGVVLKSIRSIVTRHDHKKLFKRRIDNRDTEKNYQLRLHYSYQ